MSATPRSESQARFKRLESMLASERVGGLLVLSDFTPIDFIYLTGHVALGSAGLVWVLGDSPVLVLTVEWDLPRAREESWVGDIRRAVDQEQLVARAASILQARLPAQTAIAVPGLGNIPTAALRHLQDKLGLVDASSVMRALRLIKSPWEIDRLQRAAHIADVAMCEVPGLLGAGLTEREIALRLKMVMLEQGADGFAGPYVGSGPRASMPLAYPTERVHQKGELVVVDLGAFVDGYMSDICRTFVVEKPSKEQRAWMTVVDDVLRELTDAIVAGIPANSLHHKAGELFSRAGYGKAFLHHIGHDIGQDSGKLLNLQGSVLPLAPGMALTLEPGIYFGEKGGVRIEDDFVVTESRPMLLTKIPRLLGLD